MLLACTNFSSVLHLLCHDGGTTGPSSRFSAPKLEHGRGVLRARRIGHGSADTVIAALALLPGNGCAGIGAVVNGVRSA